MKRKSLVIVSFIFLSIGIFSDCNGVNKENTSLFIEPVIKYEKEAYMAFIMNSVRLWKEIVNKHETAFDSAKTDTAILFSLVRAEYGLLSSCIANQDKETYNASINKIDEHLKALVNLTPYWSKVYSLQAAIISNKLAFDPGKGMILGPKSQKAIEKAIKLNENDPIAWYQMAGSKLHTPEKFGGDVKKAIEYYQKSIDLFQKDSLLLENNWIYLSSLTWLGIAYEKIGDYTNALKSFERAQEFEPDFGWTKFVLIPEIKKKINNL